jgi:hypothetical protein
MASGSTSNRHALDASWIKHSLIGYLADRGLYGTSKISYLTMNKPKIKANLV